MKKSIGIFIGLVIIATSCVTEKKYNELLGERNKCSEDLAYIKSKNVELSSTISDMEKELNKLKSSVKALVKDTTDLSMGLTEITEKYTKLKDDYDLMLKNLNSQLSGNKNEFSKTLTDLQNTQENLLKQENQLNAQKKELENLNKALELKEAKLLELQSVLNKKDSAVNALKTKISDALMGYENNGLTILKKNGKVYVSLDEKLLFAPGSYTIATTGAEALKKLSKVLESNTDINVMIEGHTDDVPYNGVNQLKDNWDLSVMRATSVVKILLQGSTIDPKRVSAAGRSEYFPIDGSKTKEARAKNRRTEIILTPKLDELLKMLENN